MLNLSVILFIWSISYISSTIISNNFTYCDNFNPMVTLDMDFHCVDNDDLYLEVIKGLDNTTLVYDAIIMKKNKEVINTKGTQCFAKKITGYSYYNFFKSRENTVDILKLTDYECTEMKINKKCYSNEMKCEGDSCFYRPTDIYYDYSFFSTTRKESYECTIIDRLVVSYDLKTNIFNSQLSSCTATDGHCILHDSTIVWSVKSINTCPYQSLFYAFGFSIRGNIAISGDEQILFRLDSTQSICNGNVIKHTTSGLGLMFVPPNVNDPFEKTIVLPKNGLQQQKQPPLNKLYYYLKDRLEKNDRNGLKTSQSSMLKKGPGVFQKTKLKSIAASIEQLELVVAEEDYVKFQQNQQFAGLFNREEKHLCNIFKNQVDAFRQFDNTFFEINLLDSSILNIFVKDSNIFIPKCSIVEKIEIFVETALCFEDIPVNMIVKEPTGNNTSVQAFLSKDRFLRSISRQKACVDAHQTVSVLSLNLEIIQDSNKYLVKKRENVVRQSFHPSNINLTDMNFKHHIDNMAGIDLIDSFQEFSKVKEVNGDFYVIPSINNPEETAGQSLLKNLKEYRANYKFLFWFVLILFIIIISCILEKVTGILTFFFTIIKQSIQLCGICCKTGKACCGSDLI